MSREDDTEIKAVEEQLTPEETQEAVNLMLSKASEDILSEGMTPFVFANDKGNPNPFGLLNLFYKGVMSNTLGIMVAQDTEDNNSEKAVLVGISHNDEGEMVIFPVAMVLGKESVKRFLPPDGLGGYVQL